MSEVAIHSPGIGVPDLRHAQGTSSIVQVEQSRLVPWIMLACILSGLALGAVVCTLVFMPDLFQARMHAAVAKSEATAIRAQQDARIALDKVEDFRAKIAEKGINVTLDGH